MYLHISLVPIGATNLTFLNPQLKSEPRAFEAVEHKRRIKQNLYPLTAPKEKRSRSHHKNLWYLQVKPCKQIQISIPLVIRSDNCNGYVSISADKVVSEQRGLLHAVFKVPFLFCIAEIVMHLHWKLWHLLPHTRDLAWRTLFA